MGIDPTTLRVWTNKDLADAIEREQRAAEVLQRRADARRIEAQKITAQLLARRFHR